MKNNLVVTIIVAVIVGGISFFGGMQYQKSQVSNFAGVPSQFGQRMIGQGFGGSQGRQGSTPMRSGGFASGEITSIDNNTITIKTQDGSSKIIIYSDSTKVNKTSDGSKSDLKVGERITAVGTESSGSITAQDISIGNTMFRMGAPGVQSNQNGQPVPTQ
jgi:hypothetical protein